MPKVSITSQVLATIQHDGRFHGARGRNDLVDHVANRLWSLDGVNTVDAHLVGDTGDLYVTVPKARYEELLAAERHFKESSNVE